jgi:hypothetical protein
MTLALLTGRLDGFDAMLTAGVVQLHYERAALEKCAEPLLGSHASHGVEQGGFSSAPALAVLPLRPAWPRGQIIWKKEGQSTVNDCFIHAGIGLEASL